MVRRKWQTEKTRRFGDLIFTRRFHFATRKQAETYTKSRRAMGDLVRIVPHVGAYTVYIKAKIGAITTPAEARKAGMTVAQAKNWNKRYKAACPVCGGWTGFGGMSQFQKGPLGCHSTHMKLGRGRGR